MKLSSYLASPASEIVRQPLRSLLTISAIIISGALLVTLVTLGIESRQAVVNKLTEGDEMRQIAVSTASTASGGLFESDVKVANTSVEKLDQSTVNTLATIKSVESVTPQVSMWELQRFVLEGSDSEFVARATSFASDPPKNLVQHGTWFDNTSPTPQIVLGTGYAKALGYSGKEQELVGKSITLITAQGYRGVGAEIPAANAPAATREAFATTRTRLSATIVGVTHANLHDDQLYVPYAWAQQIKSPRTRTAAGEASENSIEKQGFSIIMVTAASDDEVAEVTESIKKLGFGVSSTQHYLDQINQLSVVVWLVLGAVALIALISAALGIMNTLLMTITEQARTIAIWRACGAKKAMISRMYIIQAGILGLVGGTIGVAIGAVITHIISAKVTSALAAQGLANITIPPASPTIIIASILLVTLLSMIAGIYPARRAANNASNL